MRLFFLALSPLLFLVACAPKTGAQLTERATPPTQNTAPAAAPRLSDTTLLWKITSLGGGAPSYLFGTIHIIAEEDYFMPNKVVSALNASEHVVFEIDPRDMKDPMQMMSLMSKINMSDGSSLSDHLDAEQYKTVKNYFADLGLPFMVLERLKPMFLSAMVGQDDPMGGGMPGMGGLGGGMQGSKSYELELTKVAEAAGKSIGGLETMDFQLGLFDSIPYDVQATMLYEAVTNDAESTEDDTASQLEILTDMYKRQAIAEMASLMSEESAGMGNFEELLLTRRNEAWAPVIKKQAGEKATFYAVGAGHLGGPSGVIALLRGMGVSVEPVF